MAPSLAKKKIKHMYTSTGRKSNSKSSSKRSRNPIKSKYGFNLNTDGMLSTKEGNDFGLEAATEVEPVTFDLAFSYKVKSGGE